MKDIYSPLEIDESWDQRAPMIEGDMADMHQMQEWAPQVEGTGDAVAASGAEAPAGAPAESSGMGDGMHAAQEGADSSMASPDMPAAEAAHDSSSEASAKDDETMPMPEASDSSTSEAPSDDEAVSKLSVATSAADTDHDPHADTSQMTPAAGDTVMPTVKVEPTEPRVQPAESDIAETKSDDKSDDAAPEMDTDTKDHGHFILGETATSPMDVDKKDDEMPAGDKTPETMSGSEGDEGIDTKIEAAMGKINEAIAMLKQDKEEIAALVSRHEKAEEDARGAKEHAQAEHDKVTAELDKLESLKPAA